MKNNSSAPASQDVVAAAELSDFLRNLPLESTLRRGYNKDELQIRLPKEQSERLKLLFEAVSYSPSHPCHSSQAGILTFRPDRLITYLVSEFLTAYGPGVDTLIATRLSARHQAERVTALARKNLLTDFNGPHEWYSPIV